MYTIPKYRSAKLFKKAVRNSIKNLDDCVIVNNVIYTMDNYDLEGREITYGNVKFKKTLIVNNYDRYKSTEDTTVKIEEGFFFRNDINYIQ